MCIIGERRRCVCGGSGGGGGGWLSQYNAGWLSVPRTYDEVHEQLNLVVKYDGEW